MSFIEEVNVIYKKLNELINLNNNTADLFKASDDVKQVLIESIKLQAVVQGYKEESLDSKTVAQAKALIASDSADAVNIAYKDIIIKYADIISKYTAVTDKEALVSPHYEAIDIVSENIKAVEILSADLVVQIQNITTLNNDLNKDKSAIRDVAVYIPKLDDIHLSLDSIEICKVNINAIIDSYDNSISSFNSSEASSKSAKESSENLALALASANNALEYSTQAEENKNAFFDVFLGSYFGTPPSPIKDGSLYFNKDSKRLMVYSDGIWNSIEHTPTAYRSNYRYVATDGQIDFAVPYRSYHDIDVFINGIKILQGYDYIANDLLNISLTRGAQLGDAVDIVVFGAFKIADTLSKFDLGELSNFSTAFDSAKV